MAKKKRSIVNEWHECQSSEDQGNHHELVCEK